jgi:pseudouridine-5'-phosphate glycosidase
MERMNGRSGPLRISSDVSKALSEGSPVIGLETAVLTHGLPRPQNEEIFLEMMHECVENDAVPAPIAMIDGVIRIGLTTAEVGALATKSDPVKLGVRDLPFALAKGVTGGTTVSATLRCCSLASIEVMATGGIGGVHRGKDLDISSDPLEFTRSRVLCVCSGPKSVLDVRATYELLEAFGVPVAAFQSDELPSFFSRSSGIRASWRIDHPDEAVSAFRTLDGMMAGGMLLANPVDEALSISPDDIDSMMGTIVERGEGKDVTPMVLAELNRISQGRTLRTNRSLLIANVGLAARIASSM